jgi:hypothetical protein
MTVDGANPMTLQIGPVIPMSVRYAVPREDPLVPGDDVRMRTDDHAHPPVEVQAERVLLGRQLAMEIDKADRRQRLGRRRLVEQRVGVGERVIDGLHVRPALEVDDRDVRPSSAS